MVLPDIGWRGALAAGGLLGLFALEQLRPFKPPVDRRPQRWGRNVFLSLFNSAGVSLVFGGAIVAYTAWLESKRIGLLHWVGLPPALGLGLTVVYLDFTVWAFHRAYHNVEPMWRLHRVHHSDLDLDVTSASRFHLAEILLSTVYRFGVVTLLGPTFQAVLVFEALLLLFAQFEHSNIALPGDWERRLRPFIITPDIHRVHHDDVRSHTNSNFGTILSCWDRWFGTYRCEGISQAAIRIGLPEYRSPDEVTVGKLLAMPLAPGCSPEFREDPA